MIKDFISFFINWPELLVQAYLLKNLFSAIFLENFSSFMNKNLLIHRVF